MYGCNQDPMRILALRSTSIPALFVASPSTLFRRPPVRNPNPSFHPHLLLSRRLMASGSSSSFSSIETQFRDFRVQLEGSGSIRERIRAAAAEAESATRLIQASLLLVHQSLPIPEVIEKAKVQIEALKEHFGRIAEILQECPGQYYRYHGDWKSETQTAVSLIAFLHWLETGDLLMHADAQRKLGMDASEFGLDIEDYLIGICFMSNELPRYVVNQVTAGDYDCPRKVLKFLTELHASFRMLNLRNDFLRKKFDGMKYDLRRVEEVYYDVKIRGLVSGESTQVQNTKAE
ncbi:translin [Iris pallida]|uniref:Translin n=1 Tax=Iris pallida TaxID=29817 RepID=A0AAX6H2N2_IRIPA|nr:translin [Iris pallida]KAJ6836700.1 translin [Iris pallida]